MCVCLSCERETALLRFFPLSFSAGPVLVLLLPIDEGENEDRGAHAGALTASRQ